MRDGVIGLALLPGDASEYGCDASQNAGSDYRDGNPYIAGFQQLKILIGKAEKVVKPPQRAGGEQEPPFRAIQLPSWPDHGTSPMRKHPEIFTRKVPMGKGAKDPLTRYF